MIAEGRGAVWNIFRQHAASIYGFVRSCVSFVRQKKFRPLLSKVGGWDLVCWLLSQILDQPRCYGRWKTTFCKDDQRWKTTFIGKQPSVGRWPSVEDNFWWKITFAWRQTLVEDDLQWKMTFGERQPSMEDDLWSKTTFGQRQPSVEGGGAKKIGFFKFYS